MSDVNAMCHAASPVVELLGYAAAALVLLAFSLRSPIALRAVAIASNLAFMAHALGVQLQSVLFLHAALLPINMWRLWQGMCVHLLERKEGSR